MRRAALIVIAVLAGFLALFLLMGLDERLARMALGLQRDYQNALAGALRALRAGQPGAVAGFLGICFTYGFLHAVGPGHGKAVIGAYGLGSQRGLGWMVGLAALSSLAQATVAVVLVYAGVWAFGGARDRIEGLAGAAEPFSALAIALLGGLLCWRGARRVIAARQPHRHDAHCGCGHAHAPDPAQIQSLRNWREAAALVAGVALRPCTGALFLLILTWRLGLDGIGIAGAYAMGLGTLMVTGLAAALAVALRGGVMLSLPRLRGGAGAMAMLELGVGGAIAALAISAAWGMV